MHTSDAKTITRAHNTSSHISFLPVLNALLSFKTLNNLALLCRFSFLYDCLHALSFLFAMAAPFESFLLSFLFLYAMSAPFETIPFLFAMAAPFIIPFSVLQFQHLFRFLLKSFYHSFHTRISRDTPQTFQEQYGTLRSNLI